jgi:hypothetical protein
VPTAEDKLKYIEPLKKDFVKNSGPFMRNMFHKDADPKLVELVVRNVARSNSEIAINTMEYYFDTRSFRFWLMCMCLMVFER